MADIVPRWMWQPPGDIIERLVGRSESKERRGAALDVMPPSSSPKRDRYYRQARRVEAHRLHVELLTKWKR